MYVKIGKYPAWHTCRIHDRWMDRKYGTARFSIARSEYTKLDKFFEKIENFIQGFYNLTINKLIDAFHKKQRVKVRIDDYDVWSMDTTLAHIVVPMLKRLKGSKKGAPAVDNKDVPKALRMSKKELEQFSVDGTTDEKFFARWDYVMDEMLFAFESKINEWEDKYVSGEIDWTSTPIDRDGNEVDEDNAVYYTMKEGPNHTYEVDYEGMEKHHKRVQNGMMLFAKYYDSLWD